MKYASMRWKRPFSLGQVEDALTTLAEIRPRGMIVFEIIGRGGKEIQYVIGADARFLDKVEQAFKAHGEVRFKRLDSNNYKGRYKARPRPSTARMLKITRAKLSLNTEISAGMLRAGLATLGNLDKGETAVIQIIIGAAYPPTFAPTEQYDVGASWLDVVLGNVKKASSEQMKAMREKASQYSFDCAIRIGASGARSGGILNSLAGVFRTMSSAGAHVLSKDIDPDEIILTKVPWRMPLRLSVTELAMCMLLPTGDEEYQGVADIHPLELTVPDWYRLPSYKSLIRSFATAPDPAGGEDIDLSISPRDALEHTVIMGPTGSGKSTVMLNLIMADINAGRSVIVIDPKADLVNDILSRMPEHRLDDLVVIDPADDKAVGWNPLESSSKKHPELVADAILAVFRDIFSENWGIRAQENLSAALLTLANKKDATLMWLPALLTDEEFRKRIISEPLDQIALKPFWDQYNRMKESERRTMIESSLNKVRQIMFRPGLRNILGQAHPKFKLKELFTKRKVVLVPLNKGLIGADSARLLGSLLVGLTWIEVLSRANIPQEKRHTVSMYIDELQDYVSLPGSFADSLAQARGLGLAITVAYQYRSQLSPDLRDGVDANCRNKIIFGLMGSDASAMAHLTKELEPIDFMSLPRYHIYTNFMVNGKSSDWVSATTMKASEPIRVPAEAKAISQTKYGKASEEVEREIIDALFPKSDESIEEVSNAIDHILSPDKEADKSNDTNVAIGRKKL